MSPELPEELLEEILLKLPSRSLIRFKTVSKKWLKLITNNRFIVRQHSTVNARNLASFLLLHQSVLSLMKLFFNFVPISLDHAVTNSNLPGVEGIQLIIFSAGFGIYCFSKSCNRYLHLWNPTTRECIDLPPPPCGYNAYAFRPSFYFGKVDYEDQVFSYNVGMITPRVYSENNDDLQMSWLVKFYSSKTNTWTFTTRPNIYDGLFLHQGGLVCVNLNGKAHWVTRREVGDDQITNIITFDYENQALVGIPIRLAPEVGRYNLCNGFLTLWDETFLCLLLSWEKDDKLFIDIWVMREYMVDTSFIKELTIGPFSKYARVLGFSSKLQILFFQPERYTNSLIFYDLKSSSIKECSIPGGQDGYGYYLQITEHVESLVSLLK